MRKYFLNMIEASFMIDIFHKTLYNRKDAKNECEEVLG